MQDQSIEDIEPEFGRWVRDQRKGKGLSQGELAHLTGMIDASALSRIESGKRSVRLSEAVAIAQAVGSPFLSAQFTERVDPVRRVTSDVLAACQEADRARVYALAADHDLRRALEAESGALDRLGELASQVPNMSAESQAEILLTFEEFKRAGGRRRDVYVDMLRAASPEVRARFETGE